MDCETFLDVFYSAHKGFGVPFGLWNVFQRTQIVGEWTPLCHLFKKNGILICIDMQTMLYYRYGMGYLIVYSSFIYSRSHQLNPNQRSEAVRVRQSTSLQDTLVMAFVAGFDSRMSY